MAKVESPATVKNTSGRVRRVTKSDPRAPPRSSLRPNGTGARQPAVRAPRRAADAGRPRRDRQSPWEAGHRPTDAAWMRHERTEQRHQAPRVWAWSAAQVLRTVGRFSTSADEGLAGRSTPITAGRPASPSSRVVPYIRLRPATTSRTTTTSRRPLARRCRSGDPGSGFSVLGHGGLSSRESYPAPVPGPVPDLADGHIKLGGSVDSQPGRLWRRRMSAPDVTGISPTDGPASGGIAVTVG